MKVPILLICVSLCLAFAPYASALTDDFDDGKDDGWTVIQGDWEVEDGEYRQKDTVWTTTTTNETYHRSFFGDVNWSDYTVEVDLIIDEPGELAPIAGVFVRVTEKSADGLYYFFRIDTRPDQAPAAVESPNNNFKGENGGRTEGANANDGLKDPAFLNMDENDVEYHLKVVAEGDHFLYYIDDQLILDITDDVDPFLKGAVGLGTFNAGTSFDNFQINGEGIPKSVNREGKLTICWGALKAEKE